MEAATIIGLVAAAAAVASWWAVKRQVDAMWAQTKLQKQIAEDSAELQRKVAEDAAQPYVWADVRISTLNGWDLMFVVGNSGSTVATNVKVNIDPPFPAVSAHEAPYLEPMHTKLADGLASLAPDSILTWTLGPSPDVVNREGPLIHSVRIECDGPFGAVPVSEYDIDLASFRESTSNHSGTLKDITKAIEEAGQRFGQRG
jgi:hypothetical protein